MITLTRDLTGYLTDCRVLHPNLCPKQVIGVRMARLACSLLGVDPALERKRLFIFMESRRCAADAVIIVTGASPSNELMQFMDYGKLAATFVDLRTNRAVRIMDSPQSRTAAVEMFPNLSVWEAQLRAYQHLPDHLLLRWEWVRLCEPLPLIREKHVVKCDSCGEKIHEHAEIVQSGYTLCKPCAVGSYYQPLRSLCNR